MKITLSVKNSTNTWKALSNFKSKLIVGVSNCSISGNRFHCFPKTETAETVNLKTFPKTLASTLYLQLSDWPIMSLVKLSHWQCPGCCNLVNAWQVTSQVRMRSPKPANSVAVRAFQPNPGRRMAGLTNSFPLPLLNDTSVRHTPCWVHPQEDATMHRLLSPH